MESVQFLDPGDKKSIELLKEILNLASMLAGGNFPIEKAEKAENFFASMRAPVEKTVVPEIAAERPEEVVAKKVIDEVGEAMILASRDVKPETTFPAKTAKKQTAMEKEKEEEVFVIGEFEENHNLITDKRSISLNSQKLLKFLENPDENNTGWHVKTIYALEDFVTKFDIGELYLQEKRMRYLDEIKARNCLLKKPNGGLAFIRIRHNDQIIPWPDFNKDLLGKIIGPDGIEYDQIADIIHIAVPQCKMTAVTFFKFPYNQTMGGHVRSRK